MSNEKANTSATYSAERAKHDEYEYLYEVTRSTNECNKYIGVVIMDETDPQTGEKLDTPLAVMEEDSTAYKAAAKSAALTAHIQTLTAERDEAKKAYDLAQSQSGQMPVHRTASEINRGIAKNRIIETSGPSSEPLPAGCPLPNPHHYGDKAQNVVAWHTENCPKAFEPGGRYHGRKINGTLVG